MRQNKRGRQPKLPFLCSPLRWNPSSSLQTHPSGIRHRQRPPEPSPSTAPTFPPDRHPIKQDKGLCSMSGLPPNLVDYAATVIPAGSRPIDQAIATRALGSRRSGEHHRDVPSTSRRSTIVQAEMNRTTELCWWAVALLIRNKRNDHPATPGCFGGRQGVPEGAICCCRDFKSSMKSQIAKT